LWSAVGTIVSLALTVAGAQETPADSSEEQYAKVAEGPKGVSQAQRDKKGRVVSCLVVGKAPIREALQDARGMEMVRRRAQLCAYRCYIAWLKEDVRVKQNEVKGTERVTWSAEADMSDLQNFELVYQQVDAKEKIYTVVLRWVRDK
jgi:hypothetical protein